MNTNTNLHPRVEIVRVLVFVQAGIIVVSAIEASVSMLAFGPSGKGLLIINATLAALLFLLANRLVAGSNWARRTLRLLQVLMIVWALFDMALAIGLAGRSIELVAIVSRIVVPIFILRTLRKKDVKASFTVPAVPSQPSTLTGAVE